MSQRKEKYARSMARRMDSLERAAARHNARIETLEENQIGQCAGRAIDSAYVQRMEESIRRKIRLQRQRTERAMDRQRMLTAFAIAIAAIAIFMSVAAIAPKQIEADAGVSAVTSKTGEHWARESETHRAADTDAVPGTPEWAECAVSTWDGE